MNSRSSSIPEFWKLGLELFKDEGTCPIPFIPGDIFSDAFLADVKSRLFCAVCPAMLDLACGKGGALAMTRVQMNLEEEKRNTMFLQKGTEKGEHLSTPCFLMSSLKHFFLPAC